MSPNIPGNVFKRSRECLQIFCGCLQIFWEMSSNIPWNVEKYSRECRQIFPIFQTLRRMSVLHKEMRTQGQSKISSCYFCVWCKSRELEGRGSLKFPCVIPNLESFSSDLLGAIISYWEESHLDSGQTSTMERFCKNSQRL